MGNCIIVKTNNTSGSYTAGDGIDITNSIVSNTAGMYTENVGTSVSNPVPINADLLEGHDSSYFAKANDIPSGLTLLWTNSDPDATFGDTTITLDLSEFNYVLVTFKMRASTTYYVDIPFAFDTTAKVAWGLDYSGSSNPIVARAVYANSTSVHFNVAYSYGAYLTGTRNDNVLIPYKIYGGY